MNEDKVKAKIAEYEAELKRLEMLMLRLQGAVAGLRDLLEPIEQPEPPKE